VNQFLYYSGHGITEPIRDPAIVRRGLQEGRFALLTADAFARVAEGDTAAYAVIAASGSWRLVQARPRGAAPEPRATPAPG